MTPEQFMHALAELVAEAEDAGLPTEMVADELVAMAGRSASAWPSSRASRERRHQPSRRDAKKGRPAAPHTLGHQIAETLRHLIDEGTHSDCQRMATAGRDSGPAPKAATD